MNSLNINITRKSDEVTVSMTGQLASMDAIDMKEALPQLVEANDKTLNIDLQQVEATDLTGLNALFMTKLSLEKMGRKFNLIVNHMNPILDLLHLTKMTNHFNIVFAA